LTQISTETKQNYSTGSKENYIDHQTQSNEYYKDSQKVGNIAKNNQ
jgi:hypothetical protein